MTKIVYNGTIIKNFEKRGSVLFKNIRPIRCIAAFIGSAVLAFGLYEIHSFSGVTEGGQLGLTLLLAHWFDISPALSSFVFNVVFYITAWRTLGREFLVYSAVSAVGFSSVYWVCEQFEPLFPGLYNYPLAASLIGALFVGAGVGTCVRAGGAPSGDDGLAMSLSKILKVNISWIYLIFDVVVLGLSLTYIPIKRIIYSFLTSVLSGQIIGIMQKIKK